MNYYEELGLTPAAGPEEIRQAYRSMIRILHPDQFQDERLKRLAECQVKRIQEVIEVLSDPVRRSRYDVQMRSGELAKAASVRRRAHRAAYAAALAVPVLAALWWGIRQSPAPPRAPLPRPEPRRQLAARLPVPEPRKQDKAPQPVPDERTVRRREGSRRERQNGRLRTAAPAPASGRIALASPVPTLALQARQIELSSAPVLVAPVPQPPAPLRADSAAVDAPLAGEWVYVARRSGVSEGKYPPEFIEMKITGQSGRLAGRYWARHRIKDQAVSSEVAFEFEGRSTGKSAQVIWTGNGGAEGAARLTMLAADAILIQWWTTQSGQRPSLTSGSATLMRR